MPTRVPRLSAVASLDALPEGRPRVVLAPDGTRLVCVRRGDAVDVLDDRCPHEGFSLSQGTARDGVLTCPWHNWKFELSSGRCLHGGESVRRHASEVHEGELFVAVESAPAARADAVREDLFHAVERGSVDGVLRQCLRLERSLESPHAGGDELLLLWSERAPHGRGQLPSVLRAARSLRDAGALTAAEALALCASVAVAEVGSHWPRTPPLPQPGTLRDAEPFLLALVEERRSEAEARVLGLPASVSAQETLDAWLLPFASLKLWDGGLALRNLAAARALGASLPAPTARALAAALCVQLGWATAETDLAGWRHARQGLLDARSLPAAEGPLEDASALLRAAREGEEPAVRATLRALERSAPRLVLGALAAESVHALAAYPTERSRRTAGRWTAARAARPLLLAHAARTLPEGPQSAAHAVLAASLLGRLASVCPRSERAPELGSQEELLRAAGPLVLGTHEAPEVHGGLAQLAAALCELAVEGVCEPGDALAALRRASEEEPAESLARLAHAAERTVRGELPEEE